ncbi:histone deacetylase family protein [Halomicrobium urmianum]|uniref:histone deacetylase family protein n=1 Tax=Halomicrobium urmianum TaxID=1586233 RepID=UPI001CD9F659|nr:histone deacetylase [Halomicrobium urmianum]
MNFGYREVCLDHDTGKRHPESPDRLRAIRRGLAECHDVEYVAPDDADVDLIKSVHDPDYVDEVRDFCESGGGNWDADTVACEDTWPAILASAGLAEWAAERALAGDEGRETPFALGRPPGHHAVADDAMGFCFVNNVSVAAQAALESNADRVAIVDWDVHHGNGTQDIWYDDGDVLFASLHEEGLYPGTGEVQETGEGDGEMRTINVPYPPGADTTDYLAAVDEVIGPSFRAFDPDLVLVSAGFDAHRHDPISRMEVSSEGYGLLADRVRSIADDCDAGLAFVLEGGYNLDTLTDSLTTVHEVFDRYSPSTPDVDEVSEGAREVLDELIDQGFGDD